MQKTWKRAATFVRSDYLWLGIIFLGVFLRLRQYILNRSLWGDEAALALNLVSRSFRELTKLLDYHQAAPIGFLFIEKLSITIFGNHDYIMRLFPLFTGILAIYFIYRFAREHFGTAGLFAVGIFSIGWWLVYYSSELKQYSSDVMIALLLVFLAGNCLRKNVRTKDFLLLGVVGSLVIWISHPSVFIMAGIGLVLVIEKFTRKEYVPWVWILGIGIGWLASFGIEYLVSLQNIVGDGYLIKYWQKAYIPSPFWSDKSWYLNTYYSFLLIAFHRADGVMALATLVLTIIGTLSLLIRDKKIALLVILPFVVSAIASAFQRYPLKDRFMLFLIPFALLLMAEGFRGIYWLVAKWNHQFAAIFSWILAFAIIGQVAPVNYRMVAGAQKDTRPAIEYLVEHRQPDDIIYVFHPTVTVFKYYAPFYGLDKDRVVFGVERPSKRVTIRRFKDDVDGLVGNKRVWFIFSELLDCVQCEAEDTQSYYLDYIDNFGVILDSFNGTGANAYLYDLSP